MTRRQVTAREDDTLYSIVHSLPSGTIFQVERGGPWMRTGEGVVGLIPEILPITPKANRIPDNWKHSDYDQLRVFVIHDPRVDEGRAP